MILLLIWDFVPPPQVLEHAPLSDQPDQTQSTEKKLDGMWNSIHSHLVWIITLAWSANELRYFCHGLSNFGYFYTLPTIIRVCPFTRTWKKNIQLALLIRTCPFSIGQLQRSTHCKKNLACSQGVWFNYLTVGQKLLSKLGWNLLRLSYPVFGLWELFLVILGAY